MNGKKRVLLLGNANVGKSTVFNEITGSHQHTGNWTGKTVDTAKGSYYYKFNDYELIDLPGTYSLLSMSEEERITKKTLCFENFDCVVCVIDATALERNLNLVLQVLELTNKAVVLLNLCDEAKKKNIKVDEKKLSQMLGIPVIKATARSGKGINELLEEVHMLCTCSADYDAFNCDYGEGAEPASDCLEKSIKPYIENAKSPRFFSLRALEGDSDTISYLNSLTDSFEDMLADAKSILKNHNIDSKSFQSLIAGRLNSESKNIAEQCTFALPSKKQRREELLDKILLGRYTSIPVMLAIIGIVLWLTILGSNYPSELLSHTFEKLEAITAQWLNSIGVAGWVISLFVNGVMKTLLWVVAVMLPPMAIFFPLFSLLEDFGFLPRLAFNLDSSFERCGACGKQALTTCMGYGCNAVGVTACRIIDSPRERLVAIITNSLTPCNGRFPLLIAVISMFFTKNSMGAAVILLTMLCLSVVMTFVTSKVLSKTVLKGESSSFVLELPSFRKPKFLRVIGETVRQKVLLVLFRAVVVAAPAGVIIWIMSNISVGDVTLLTKTAQLLEPVGSLIGLDGVILLSFILGFPANEILIPIALMAYLSSDVMTDYTSLEGLKDILVTHGWTAKTALCTCVFSMFHFPCSTTLITIWRETKSIKWTVLSVLTPLVTGVLLCAFINIIS